MRPLQAALTLANQALAWLAGVLLFMMMLVVSADIGMRLLGRPLAGSYEIIGWLSAGAMALSLGYVQLHRGHVAMTLVSARLGGKSALVLSGLTDLIAMLLFLFVSWFVFQYAWTLFTTGSLSETLLAPVYPWVMLVGLGCAGLTLVLLLNVCQTVSQLWQGPSA